MKIKSKLVFLADREHKIQIASWLLFDQNISFRIISKIEANFPNSKQVRQLGIENYSILKYGSMPKKTTIYNFFDADFLIYPILKVFHQKIIWLRFDTKTDFLADLLNSKFTDQRFYKCR
jgi:hypothetical protein